MIKVVSVVGAGTMGSGIAYVSALAGADTRLYDPFASALHKARNYHAHTLSRALTKQRLTQTEADAAQACLSYHDQLADATRGADLVIEAAPEQISLKQELFRQIETLVTSTTILGSNTSSLPITEIASVLGYPGRAIGIHFFNPAPLMTLVEIIPGLDTTPATVAAVEAFTRQAGKDPVIVKDYPGFITTRIGLMYVAEAIFALQEGVAERDALDKAMRLGYNFPMGPLELADLVGLDVMLNVLDALYDNYRDARYRAPILLRKMVQAGRLGRKSGEGFYRYPG
ncbi:MAG: 3-hydroxyacyl-CoA dehydrogenase family protein [Anaerolineae bacterium]